MPFTNKQEFVSVSSSAEGSHAVQCVMNSNRCSESLKLIQIVTNRFPFAATKINAFELNGVVINGTPLRAVREYDEENPYAKLFFLFDFPDMPTKPTQAFNCHIRMSRVPSHRYIVAALVTQIHDWSSLTAHEICDREMLSHATFGSKQLNRK